MRLLLEVIGKGMDNAKFPRRGGNGQTETVPYFWASGVDNDYQDQLIKVKVYRPKNINRLNEIKKGDKLKVKFRTLKRDDQYERCTIINAVEEDVELYNGAEAKPEVQSAVAA